MNPKRCSDAQIAEALRNANGLVSHAAERLKLSVRQTHERIASSEELQKVRDECREAMIDKSESLLFKRMEESDTLLIFHLKTQGKRRGYVEKSEVDVTSGGEPIKALIGIGLDEF